MHHLHTEEARQARQGITTYEEAMCAIFDRRRALSGARPRSAHSVGEGNAILYRQGVLCVQKYNHVTVRNLRSEAPVVNIDLAEAFYEAEAPEDQDTFELLYYSDGIIAVRIVIRDEPRGSPIVMFVSTSHEIHDHARVLTKYHFGYYVSELFVRHNAEYLCIGTYGIFEGDGHRLWQIRILAFDHPGKEIEQIFLDDFHGYDIGSTVAFDIHDGYFYAISNQSTFEAEEIDWTSFYHCVRIPLDNAVEEAVQRDRRVYRRQHAEGAIHDSWTDLTLQHDERTNDLYIVEGRREWIGASSRQARTFYTTRISFSSPPSARDFDTDVSSDKAPLPLPQDDVLTTVLGSCHSANYLPTPRQYSWTRHCELSHTSSESLTHRPFILARTKFRAYNLSSSTFIDLVEDEVCCTGRHLTTPLCLKLRLGSRRIAPAGCESHCWHDHGSVTTHTILTDSRGVNRVQFEDGTRYRYTPVRLWPPPVKECPCSARLHQILNPTGHLEAGTTSQRDITAISDERSIVYMIKPSKSYGYASTEAATLQDPLGQIVLIDFGRSPTPSSPQGTNLLISRSWTTDLAENCKKGTCH